MSSYEIAFGWLIGIVALGGVWAWAHIIQHRHTPNSLLPLAPREYAPWELVDILMALILTIAFNGTLLIAARGLGWKLATNGDFDTPQQQTIAVALFSLSSLLALAATLLLIRIRTGAAPRQLGWPGDNVSGDLTLGDVCLLGAVYSRLFDSVGAVQALARNQSSDHRATAEITI